MLNAARQGRGVKSCYGYRTRNGGIEIAPEQAKVEGAVLANDRVDNQLGAILEFVDRVLDGRLVMGAALESCCGAANLAEELREHGWEVDLAHAGICSRMK